MKSKPARTIRCAGRVWTYSLRAGYDRWTWKDFSISGPWFDGETNGKSWLAKRGRKDFGGPFKTRLAAMQAAVAASRAKGARVRTIRPWRGWAVTVRGEIHPWATFKHRVDAESKKLWQYAPGAKVIRIEIRAVAASRARKETR